MSKSTTSSKKVISQHELRRIMNEQKKKLPQIAKKIESPLAKYTDSGELRCILCDTAVRGESLWSAHVASREHIANIAAAKRSREKMLAPPLKRTAPPLPPPPAKKPKSILKNSGSSASGVPADFFDSNGGGGATVKTEIKQEEKKSSGLLLGQYSSDEEEDVKPKVTTITSSRSEPQDVEMEEEPAPPVTAASSDTLPEGFFDDPKLDAKVRNVEYRDPIEEEWEKFQRAIKEEAAQSHQMIQEEQEEATAERQLEEIDEQMRNWSKVLELERRKEQVAMETGTGPENEGAGHEGDKSEEESEEDLDQFDEFLDWRAKQS